MPRKLNRIVLLIGLGMTLALSVGFRVYDTSAPWKNISATPAAKTKIFVVYDSGSTTLTNDLDAADPLAATNPITVANAMTSVFSDYNNVAGAYVQLVDNTDTDYAVESLDRKIIVKRQATDGLNGGQTSFTGVSSGKVYECTISLADSAYDGAKAFLAIATHELGHCLGLDHPMDTVNAIMSYFYNSKTNYRLLMDDKMALVFLYPTDSAKAKEEATFGASCARRQ